VPPTGSSDLRNRGIQTARSLRILYNPTEPVQLPMRLGKW
jgi:hypothetical protein